MKPQASHLPFLLLGLFLACAVLAYAPGLRGGFVFDDFANLPALGAYGPIHDLPSFWRYLTSGSADPTGRPIALLSFLIDAHDWPADPLPFKRTNLLLHLLNGALLFALLRRLGRTLTADGGPAARLRGDLAAALGSGCWLLHPLFVSTTLYVVQREAMLPATFVLLGLLGWLRGRAEYDRGRPLAGAAWCIAGLAGGTLLATLSKANGALLPLFALLLDSIPPGPSRTGIASGAAKRAAKSLGVLRALLLWLPTLAVVAWLLYQGLPDVIAGRSHGRPWTIGQRLLTEPGILLDYLRLLLVPHPYTSGLFNDQIVAARSLFDPPSTVWSILAVLALLAAGFGLRRKAPALSLAVLFFFGGHLLESTVLPLELYFEHRNYVPALLLFWPLALFVCGVPQTARARARSLPRVRVAPRAALAAILLAGLALMTHARADLWGNQREQGLVWARINPHSPRAQANAAQMLIAGGHPELAVAPLRRALDRAPDQIQIALNLFGAQCRMDGVSAATFAATEQALRTTPDPGTLLTHWFGGAIGNGGAPLCPQADYAHIARLLDAFGQNRRLMAKPGRRQDLAYLRGLLALAQGHAEQALPFFDEALDQQLRVEAALQQAALLGSAGYPELGLAHLSHYEAAQAAAARAGKAYRPPFGMPRLHAWVLRRQGYWDRERARLQATLRDDMRAKQVTVE